MKPEQRVPINLYGIRRTVQDALGSLWRHRAIGSSGRTWRTAFRTSGACSAMARESMMAAGFPRWTQAGR